MVFSWVVEQAVNSKFELVAIDVLQVIGLRIYDIDLCRNGINATCNESRKHFAVAIVQSGATGRTCFALHGALLLCLAR